MSYDRQLVSDAVEADFASLFEPYAKGRPENWTCSQSTRDIVSIGAWVDRELRRLQADDEDRRILLHAYTRRTSRELDPFDVAAKIMNEFGWYSQQKPIT